jgi:protein kinase-like protein
VTTQEQDLRGRQLQGGKYQLVEKLAEGGMASVWSAQMRSLETLVAVKVLSPALSNHPEFREQFQAEAHRIAELHHPNIIEVHDCEAEDELMYIAMRYVPGGSLSEYLKHLDGPMDLSLAAKLTAQLASALEAAHVRGLIHQDVKPANVLLGRADWPLLSDFGIAGAGTREERGGHITGTPPYMSPEQWQGVALGPASDQYSLAAMFYQLVTRQPPFQADSGEELRRKVLNEPPRRPRELNPGIPGPVEEVVLRALAKRPEDRFGSITDFSGALVEAVERSRGMQLETKQALVESVAGIVAVLGISILTPALVSVADPDRPVLYELTLNWPILVLLALIQAAVLFSIRWQLVGLLSRALGSVLDALDRFTRLYARLGTDPRGPLNLQQWRNAVVGSSEHIVGIVYVLLLYGLIGVPLIKTISLAWDLGAEPLVATVVAALVLVLVGANLLAMWRVSGAVVATLALAVCWVFIGSMPIVDRAGFGGISLQWATKLAIGLAVVVALLSLRKRVQSSLGAVLAPMLQGALSRSGVDADASADAQRWSDALVNVAYFIITFSILAVPARKLLEPLTSPTVAAVVVTVVGVALVLLIVDVLRRAQGFGLAILGLFVCAPTLLGLPLWESGAVGSGLQWIVRCLIGLGILLLLIGLRGRARRAARVLLVPVLDRQISALYAPRTEADAEARLRLLERVSDGVIDLLYVLCAYVAVVVPVVGALSGSDFSWLVTVVYLAFVGIAGWLLYRVWRHAGAAGLGTPSTAEPELAAGNAAANPMTSS